MHSPELLHLFTAPLESLGLVYMVTGSVACTVYGEPRMTHDVDIVLDLSATDVGLIEAAFPPDQFYCPPPEIIQIEARRRQRGHFNLIHHATGYRADIYLRVNGPLHDWALQHRRPVDLPGGRIHLAPPEYVILRKLEYYREGGSEKHLRDIRGVLELCEQLDQQVLQGWVVRLGLALEWEKARLG